MSLLAATNPMFKIKLIAVGFIKHTYLNLGIEEYKKRLLPLVELSIHDIPETPIKTDREEDITKALHADGLKIKNLIPNNAYIVLLDIQGQKLSSEVMAKKIETLQLKTSQLVMVIGGSHGIDQSIRNIANEKWSFSDLTFPHQLFRLMLLEQIYRSMTILKGHPYHK